MRRPNPFRLLAGLPILLALAPAILGTTSTPARAGTWRVDLEPAYVDVLGHDQHVLTIHEPGGAETRVELDPDQALGYRARVLWDRDAWSFGLDFFIHRTDHGVGTSSSATAPPGGEVRFEIAGRTFVSTGPGEALYHRVLEDSTIELWVLDVYATRPIGQRDSRSWELILGIRNADFDNDYRSVAGIDGVRGTRVDASSNYSRMAGPLVGLGLELERGRHEVRLDLRQSVVLGEVELSRTLRDFSGPPGPFAGEPEGVPEGQAQDRLRTTEDVEIPMTDLRLEWTFQATPRFSVGGSLGGTAWWGLSVPPGVRPGAEDRLNEVDLVTYGLGVTVGYTF